VIHGLFNASLLSAFTFELFEVDDHHGHEVEQVTYKEGVIVSKHIFIIRQQHHAGVFEKYSINAIMYYCDEVANCHTDESPF
jgi:hypothetical protein